MSQNAANLDTVARLLTILAGKTPIAAGVDIMAQDVVANFDGWRFEGINLWANWIHYLRTRTRVTELDLEVDRIEPNPDGTITAHGRWRGLRRGMPVVSEMGVVTYRFHEGRIVEIWTTRHNYVLLIGPYLRYRWGLVLMLLQLYLWKRVAPQLDLTAGAPADPVVPAIA